MARRYTLLDDIYYEAICRVKEALERERLPVCLVGGGAAQAWIASLRTGDGERKLSDEPILRTALRKTRDADFATRADPAAMVTLLNQLAASLGPGTHVLGPRTIRLGPVAVSLTLGPDDLSGMAHHYDAFLDSRAVLRLRRGSAVDELPTIGLEQLVATKLTRRGDKAKDLLDVTNLVAALSEAKRSLDVRAVRRFVRDDAAALSLLEEIRLELEDEPE